MKPHSYKRLLFGLAIATTICACAWLFLNSQSGPDADEEAVYYALFSPLEMGRMKSTVVVFDGTARGIGDVATSDEEFRKIIAYIRENVSQVEQDTLDDFFTKNQQPYSLKERFSRSLRNPFRVGVNFAFVNGDELSEIFDSADSDHNPWDKISAKYSGAREIYFLSRAGFNRAGTQALVYVAYECGTLCGVGYYILLAKKFGFWFVQERQMGWIS